MQDTGSRVVGPAFATGSMDVGLSDSTLWDATLSTGATSMNADFTHVRLSSLTVKTGVSSLRLRLGDVPTEVAKTDVVIKAGVSSVDITVPRTAAVRIVTNNGLSPTTVAGTFKSSGPGAWETPGFGDGPHVYMINIESGVGSVSIKQS